MSGTGDIELGGGGNKEESQKLVDNSNNGQQSQSQNQQQQQLPPLPEIPMPKKKLHRPTKNSTKYTIIFFVVMVPCLACIMETFWLLDIVENEFELFFCYVSMAFIFVMSVASYYQCVTIKNYSLLRNLPIVESTVVDPFAREINKCATCNDKWKPPRSHHCSTCGGCIIGMDHHCPWIVNCVGLRNHRAFWLFTFYMTLGGLHYCYRSWNYFYYLFDKGDFFSHHSYIMYGLWGFASMFLYPGTLLLIGLTVFHTGMILTNSTTIDVMGGTRITCPCVPESKHNRVINPFDRGVIANINNFFQGDLFFFWWPKETIGEHDGTQIPRSPYCNFSEIQSIVKNQFANNDVIEERVDVHKMTMDLDKKIEDEKHNYKDFNFIIQGKVFEYWKVYEQEQLERKQQEQQQENVLNQGQEIKKEDIDILEDNDDQLEEENQNLTEQQKEQKQIDKLVEEDKQRIFMMSQQRDREQEIQKNSEKQEEKKEEEQEVILTNSAQIEALLN